VRALFVRRVYFMTCEIESDAKGQMDFLGKSLERSKCHHRLGLVHPSNWTCKNWGNSGLEKGDWEAPKCKIFRIENVNGSLHNIKYSLNCSLYRKSVVFNQNHGNIVNILWLNW
jgi:hypothetical protein